jgi:hypothetical protein
MTLDWRVAGYLLTVPAVAQDLRAKRFILMPVVSDDCVVT